MDRIEKLEGVLRNDIKGVQDSMTAMSVQVGSEIDLLKARCSYLEEENSQLWERVDRLEGFSRRSNVLFFNIPEEPKESWAMCELKVRNLVKDCMGLELGEMDIERAHRVGPPGRSSKPRKVVAKMWNYKNKERILANAKKFKANGIDVSEDFTERVKNVRSVLKKHLVSARQQGHFAKLSFDKLQVDGRLFVPGEGESLKLIGRRSTLTSNIVQPTAEMEVQNYGDDDGESEGHAVGECSQSGAMEPSCSAKEEGKRKRDGNGKVSPNVKTVEKNSKVEMERGRSKMFGRKESTGRSASPSVRDFFKSQEKPKEG